MAAPGEASRRDYPNALPTAAQDALAEVRGQRFFIASHGHTTATGRAVVSSLGELLTEVPLDDD